MTTSVVAHGDGYVDFTITFEKSLFDTTPPTLDIQSNDNWAAHASGLTFLVDAADDTQLAKVEYRLD